MKNYSTTNTKINVDNIFYNNRIGVNDSIESGRSLTLGIDYKKENIEDINKYFEFKLATSIRDKEENNLPKKSTLNRKNSNLFGSLTNNFSDHIVLDYNFAIDNDLSTFEYNELSAQLSLNNFVTDFSFIEENGEMGDANVIENSFKYLIDENNNLSFKTRRNRKLNLTEYYDLVYEYKNDCLTAGIKYKKTYYEDRDLIPSENLFFTITLFPLTTYETGNLKMILKIYKVLIFCFILIFFNQSLALENKILFKINNEIISTIDLYNETKYLSLLNKDLTNLEKDKIFEISKNSLIREKIKEIELLKNYKTLDLDKKYFDQILSNYSKKMGFENVKKFRENIEINGLNFETIQNKIKIELYWNQLIVKKFLNDVKIDKKKIKEELTRDLTQKELLLSEIVFNIDAKSNLEKKLKLIQKDIKTNGFSNAALIHGISDTANNGGKLGWIKLSSLNAKIKNELKNIKVGNFSNPIVVPGGFLILKIVDERNVKKNLDTNKAIELAVNEKTNEQLNKLSIVYYNKIKKDIQINVL